MIDFGPFPFARIHSDTQHALHRCRVKQNFKSFREEGDLKAEMRAQHDEKALHSSFTSLRKTNERKIAKNGP